MLFLIWQRDTHPHTRTRLPDDDEDLVLLDGVHQLLPQLVDGERLPLLREEADHRDGFEDWGIFFGRKMRAILGSGVCTHHHLWWYHKTKKYQIIKN